MTNSKKPQQKSALLAGHGIPDFAKISARDINEGIPNLLEELEEEFLELEKGLQRR